MSCNCYLYDDKFCSDCEPQKALNIVIDKQAKQIQELQAQVARLQAILNEYSTQSLNEIKAGAIEEAADKCAHMTLDGRICYQAGLHEYAKQLREDV